MLVGDKVKSHEIEVSTLSMLHQPAPAGDLGMGIISQYPDCSMHNGKVHLCWAANIAFISV